MRNLLDFVNHNGCRLTCWKCGADLVYDDAKTKGTCSKCGLEHPFMRANKLIAMFVFRTGATSKTIKEYLDDLQNAGMIDYVSLYDSYRAL